MRLLRLLLILSGLFVIAQWSEAANARSLKKAAEEVGEAGVNKGTHAPKGPKNTAPTPPGTPSHPSGPAPTPTSGGTIH